MEEDFHLGGFDGRVGDDWLQEEAEETLHLGEVEGGDDRADG